MDQLSADMVVPGAHFFIRGHHASASYRGPEIQQRRPAVEEGSVLVILRSYVLK